jgi:hypothetical protein
MHDGHIGVVSSGRVGEGCTFYVDLKVIQIHELNGIQVSEIPSSEHHDPLTSIEVKPFDNNSPRPSPTSQNEITSLSSQQILAPSVPRLSLTSSTNSGSFISPTTQPPPHLGKNSMKVIPGDSMIEGQKLSRALVVDDVASNRKMLGRVIQSRFHQIDFAENGKIAVDLVQESELNEGATRFSVIFMDCNMPGNFGLFSSSYLCSDGWNRSHEEDTSTRVSWENVWCHWKCPRGRYGRISCQWIE